MATIIDQLVLELRLDANPFTRDIARITKLLIGFYAALAGTHGMEAFIADITRADAALGRLAANLGQTTLNLSSWESAAVTMGGSAGDMGQAIQAVSDSLKDLNLQGKNLPVEFYRLEALSGVNIDFQHGVDAYLKGIANASSKIDRATASYFIRRLPGVNETLANILITQGPNLGKWLDSLRKYGPRPEDTVAADRLQRAWYTLQLSAESLGRTIWTKLSPSLLPLLSQMTDWIDRNKEWIATNISTFVLKLVEDIKNIDWARIQRGWERFTNIIKTVTDSVGGLTNAVEIFFALWLGSRFLTVLAAITALSAPLRLIALAFAAIATAKALIEEPEEQWQKEQKEFDETPLTWENIKKAATEGYERIKRRLSGEEAPTVGSKAPAAGSKNVDEAIQAAAKSAGIDVNTMRAIASIESSMNPASNMNKTTQYKGLYQIGREEWAKYGQGDIYNPYDNAMAASRMFTDHAAEFSKRYGRAPTATEMYLMHQQGLGFYTRGAMTNIAGNPYPGMSGPQTGGFGGSFERGWGSELERRKKKFEEVYPPLQSGGFIDRGGLARLHEGEAVIPKPWVSAIAALMGGMSSGSAPGLAIGATASAMSNIDNRRSINNNTSSTHIGNLNVHTPATDGREFAAGFADVLTRNREASYANFGLA